MFNLFVKFKIKQGVYADTKLISSKFKIESLIRTVESLDSILGMILMFVNVLFNLNLFLNSFLPVYEYFCHYIAKKSTGLYTILLIQVN